MRLKIAALYEFEGKTPPTNATDLASITPLVLKQFGFLTGDAGQGESKPSGASCDLASGNENRTRLSFPRFGIIPLP
jgi:hypothetical protein